MTHEFRNKTAIVGVGVSEVSRSVPQGAGAIAVDAVRTAVEDAGLKMSDIDGLTTYAGGFEYGHGAGVDGIEMASVNYMTSALGVESLNWFGEQKGGGPALAPLAAALDAVYTGKAKCVVVYRVFARPKGRMFGIRTENYARGVEQFVLPYGAGNMLQFSAAICNRLMHDYGLTKEHFGEYVLHSHRQAMLNPHAILKQEISMDEYLSAPYYVDPLSKLDCDVPVDGAMAMVVTTADRAKELKQTPVYVSAIQNKIAKDPEWSFYTAPEYDQMTSYIAAKGIWEKAGFHVDELDFIQLYDGFVYHPFVWAAQLGLCKPEDMGDYIVEACRKGKEAEIPITTNGGCLCEGRFHGVGHVIEAVLQMQGRAEHRQLNRVQTGIVAVGGFNSCGILALQNE